jgi:hypothetical protein
MQRLQTLNNQFVASANPLDHYRALSSLDAGLIRYIQLDKYYDEVKQTEKDLFFKDSAIF